MSLEITSDDRSERFRDPVARAFLEILGPELPYGLWTVMLRCDQETLCVVITGPKHMRQEWAFDIADALRSSEMAEQFRRRPWRRQ